MTDFINGQEVIRFATEQLLYYTGRIDPTFVSHIRLCSLLDIDDKLSMVEHDPMDDAYTISVQGKNGYIAGSNPRSVLLGVYRYLSELGCAFLRPGENGEIIPRLCLSQESVCIKEKASYRHRGICIEGAVSLDHVIDMIAWMPKQGFNSYFIQFKDAYTFFERWYTHENNNLLQKQDFSTEIAANIVETIKAEIRKRDLVYHAVGHGWTCEPLGFASNGWIPVDDDLLDSDTRKYVAMLNGKRQFYQDIPINTHMCYSQPEACELFVNEVVNYAILHREVDILHVWLADNCNNLCECDECKKLWLPDIYIRMLNAIDKRLSEAGVSTKLVFLIYFELLWTPKQEQIHNPGRFILMFAPITRTYTRPFLPEGKVDKAMIPSIPAFQYNQNQFPTDPLTNLSFLFQWQDIFHGDGFDFDYHNMWDIYREMSGVRLARVLSSDIKDLQKMNMNGFVSCQLQRAYFPSGLSMYVMGKTLWNRDLPFEQLYYSYLNASFGKDYADAQAYLEGISKYFPHEYFRNELPQVDQDMVSLFEEGNQFTLNMQRVLDQYYEDSDHETIAFSWRCLSLHCTIMNLMSTVLKERANGGPQQTVIEHWRKVKAMLCKIEMEFASVLDVMFFIKINNEFFGDIN